MVLRTFKLRDATLLENRAQPWRDIEFTCPVPSMMGQDEFRFLYYLARRHYRGLGAIVDCGPLAGGSTYSLAAGLGDGPGHIYSYDVWRFWPDWRRFFPGTNLTQGDDILKLFWAYVECFQSRITPCQGDLTQVGWSGRPIEILFIDAAKSPQTMWSLANDFFPFLIPGAFVVHQDFISSECPWIHIATDILRDYFEFYDSPDGGSVCVRVLKTIPPGLLREDYYHSTPVEQARIHLTRAREATVAWYALCVWLAEATYTVDKGLLACAREILEGVEHHPAFCPEVEYDVRRVRAMIKSAASQTSGSG